MQLLATAKNPQEREAVGIVALLDVSDEELARVLSPLRASDCNVLACREHVRKWLGEMLHSQNEPAQDPHPSASAADGMRGGAA